MSVLSQSAIRFLGLLICFSSFWCPYEYVQLNVNNYTFDSCSFQSSYIVYIAWDACSHNYRTWLLFWHLDLVLVLNEWQCPLKKKYLQTAWLLLAILILSNLLWQSPFLSSTLWVWLADSLIFELPILGNPWSNLF